MVISHFIIIRIEELLEMKKVYMQFFVVLCCFVERDQKRRMKIKTTQAVVVDDGTSQ